MQNIKNYIRSNRELQTENQCLKEQIKDLIHYYSEQAVDIEILTHQFRCDCFNESKKRRIKEKEEFFTQLFTRTLNKDICQKSQKI